MNKIQLPHSENEKDLIEEQNIIKKYLTCIAVYDLPIGSDYIPSDSTFDTIGLGSASIFVTKYNKIQKKQSTNYSFLKRKNNMNRKTIGIDFDGTICKKQPYGNGQIHELPNEGASEMITKLSKEYNIVVFTVRLNPKFGGDIDGKRLEIENWLHKHNIPFDEVTNNKPSAMCYIDDRAIRFTNWQDVSSYLLQ